jgi:hypothetical protein
MKISLNERGDCSKVQVKKFPRSLSLFLLQSTEVALALPLNSTQRRTRNWERRYEMQKTQIPLKMPWSHYPALDPYSPCPYKREDSNLSPHFVTLVGSLRSPHSLTHTPNVRESIKEEGPMPFQ